MMNTTTISGNKDESEQTSLAFNGPYKRILAQKLELIHDVDVVYTPQSFAALSKLTGMYSVLQSQLNDVALSKIEGLIALYLALSEVSSAKGFSAVLTLYAKTHSQVSLISQLKSIADTLFDELTPQDSQAQSEDKDEKARPEWLNHMLTGLSDWKLLISSPGFKKISRVLTLMVTLGVVDSKSFTLGNFDLFAVRAMEKHVSAVDLIDALMETTVFFAEGAYQCFLQGSIRPIFFSSPDVVKMEEAYLQKIREYEFARNGNLEKFEGKSEAQFDKELTALIEKLAELYKTMPPGTEKKIIQTKWEALTKMSAEFAGLKVKGGLRKAPYCIKIYGSSGVGKSTFSDLAMTTVLKANNKPSTTDYIVTLNEKDKHMNTYRSYVTGIKIDDYGNTKSQFWETSPSDWIIKICNNVREAAVMADIANKGKISIEPACVTITTNVEDLHAGITSYCPSAILRRAHTHVEIRSKADVSTNNMLDTEKVKAKYGDVAQINDIWEIDVKEPVFEGNHFNNWKVIKDSIGIDEFLDYLVVHSRKHFDSQDTIVESFKEPSQLVHICEECGKLSNTCSCEVEPQFGDRIADVIKTKTDSMRVRAYFHSNVLQSKAEDIAVKHLLKMLTKLEESPYSHWTNWVPTQFLDNDYVKGAILYAGADYIEESVASYVKKYVFMTFFVMALTFMVSTKLTIGVGLAFFVFFLFYYAGIVEVKKDAYFKAIVEQNGSLHAAFMSARDKHVHYACGLFASLAVLYGVVQVVQALRRSMGAQGSLAPRSVEEIQQRDKEENVWANKKEPKVLHSEKSFPNREHTKNAMTSLIGQMCIGSKFSACFMVKTGEVMVPKHFMPEKTTKATIHYCKRRIEFVLNPKYAVQVGMGDFVLVFVPNTGPLKDTRPFFFDTYPQHPLTCDLTGITREGELFEDYLTWIQVPEVNNGFLKAPGSHYRLGETTTFPGMCMSVITRGANRSHIVGFHTGGVTGTDRGCGMSVLRQEIEAAEKILMESNESFMSGTQASDVPDTVMGKNIAVSEEVHPKCPSNFINGEKAAIAVYGSVTGRSTYSSDVIETPISKAVEEVTGVANKWGPPKFKNPIVREDGHIDNQNWLPWYNSLEVCSQPSTGFDPADVEVAMQDYFAELAVEFQSKEEYWKKEIKPMTEVQVVSGIDGRRFCDAMNSSTSMGYPLNQKKTGFLIDLPPDENNACPRTFVPEIWHEYYKAEALWDQGESSNEIFGASLKDEPTPVDKAKVRVFEAAPIKLQIGIRKYYLPIARFLSVNPLLSECAVGINSHGIEWHELAEFISKHGVERIIAGDYSKYDLTMPAQLIIAAFRIMIKIAQLSGNYSARDIRCMEAIAFEVCTPLVAYNGTLMRFMGTNPSGQNMTVYINSIVNSLLHRLAFNHVYDEERRDEIGLELGLGRRARMRDLVNLVTYGDDAMGSVMEGYDDFNHVTMANYLAENGMKFTMPDKTSEPKPFMHFHEVDFLKRRTAFNPDLGVNVGQLDESSIFKSLHSILKSKAVEPLEVSRMNIDGALREWFFYGEKHFEMRRGQMEKVAKKCRITSDALDMDYWERVEEWKLKYTPQSGESENHLFDMGDYTVESGRHLFHLYQAVRKTNNLLKHDVATSRIEALQMVREEKEYKRIHAPKSSQRKSAQEFIDVLDMMEELENNVLYLPVEEDPFESIDSLLTGGEEGKWPNEAKSVEPVPKEEILMDRVIEILGKPSRQEFVLGATDLGEIDLMYESPEVMLVIECKRVKGRKNATIPKVKAQAIKYARVMHLLRPDLTVFGLIYTEYGFGIVECLGELIFPPQFAELLDNAPIV
jgi:hypothetical protein